MVVDAWVVVAVMVEGGKEWIAQHGRMPHGSLVVVLMRIQRNTLNRMGKAENLYPHEKLTDLCYSGHPCNV